MVSADYKRQMLHDIQAGLDKLWEEMGKPYEPFMPWWWQPRPALTPYPQVVKIQGTDLWLPKSDWRQKPYQASGYEPIKMIATEHASYPL